jgi:hypothetical protein
MERDELETLRRRAGEARTLEAALLHEIAAAVRGVFPDAPAHPEALAEPTEAVLHLVDRCLPGWAIMLKGHATEPDGHWRCTLRRHSARDDDAVIGQGRGPTVPLAVLTALLSVACQRTPARTG